MTNGGLGWTSSSLTGCDVIGHKHNDVLLSVSGVLIRHNEPCQNRPDSDITSGGVHPCCTSDITAYQLVQSTGELLVRFPIDLSVCSDAATDLPQSLEIV